MGCFRPAREARQAGQADGEVRVKIAVPMRRPSAREAVRLHLVELPKMADEHVVVAVEKAFENESRIKTKFPRGN